MDFILPKRISSVDYAKLTKSIIWKNYFLMSVSMCFFYASLIGMLSINSSSSMYVFYGVFGLSALVIPQLLIKYIKFKWTLTLAFFTQLCYIALNSYTKWYTSAAIVGGFGQSLAFTCAALCIRELCRIYAKVTSSDANSIQAVFFGIFGLFLQSGGLLRYSFIALAADHRRHSQNTTSNTFNYSVCGKNICPYTELPLHATTEKRSQVSAFVICAIISIILSFLLNDIDYLKQNEDDTSLRQIITQQTKELKKQLFSLDQLIAMPITLMNAFVLTFLWFDFTRSFAACLDYMVWPTMVMYATAAILSPLFGKLVETLSVVAVFLLYWSLTLGTSVYMLFWQSNYDNTHKLFILASLLGAIESINTPLPRALYGMLFKTEAIYSSFTFFQGIGMLFGFTITRFYCTHVKIYILIAYCALCFTCGLILYFKMRRRSKLEEARERNFARNIQK